ncbi:MAG: pyridoxamine 5'-phosphate oxidase [Cyanobacteria bacterium P01_F01_bin.42]
MAQFSLADLRQNYTRAGLQENEVEENPINQFQLWFDAAVAAELPEPNAMTLSTVSSSGRPSGRIVLLKGLDQRGFVFYTNYTSRKGQELASQAWASLVFVWLPLERQVRIEGAVERVSQEETEQYFYSRPRSSQLGAWASDQSAEIRDRQVLEDRLSQLERQYADRPIPRPPHWGGLRVKPDLIEFWQGRPSRLHDRICYQKQSDGAWSIMRLAP